MPETPKKRGRPRKYATKEEKRRQDVIANRARRRARNLAHRDIRFQVYVAQPIGASPPSFSQQDSSRLTSCFDVLAGAAGSSDRLGTPQPSTAGCNTNDTTVTFNGLRSQSTEGIMPRSTYPQHSRNALKPCGTINACTISPGSPEAVAQLSCEVAANDHSIRMNDMGETSDFQLHDTIASDSPQTESTLCSSSQGIRAPPISDADEVAENNPSGREEDENTSYGEEGGDGRAMFYVESQPEDVFDADSSSESDASDTRSEMDIQDSDVPAESDLYLAKVFLERNWDHLCDCEEEENVSGGEQPGFGLQDMADYWQNLGVPDAIGPTMPLPRTGENEHAQLDWSSILSGGDCRPNFTIQKSQKITPSIKRTWDVDSVISWASCLSNNRGLYVSYHPPASRNFGSNIHVFHQGKTLHLIPHLRLGSGRQSPQFGVYVFFPGISHVCRTTTYLTNDERRMWINRLLLPAIRRCCPPDVVQHHPRSFDDVESKAYSRQRETCGGMVANTMDMHHYLPQEYLQAIWHHMTQSTEQRELAMFRGMFIVLSAKNIKLEAKSPTFQECRTKIITHLHQVLDWSRADLSNTWVDVGVEDTAASEKCTFLFKSRCLESWVKSMEFSASKPLISSERFNWNLTGQAGSARVETRQTHPLRKGGIAYAQRYNVNKDLFSTASKRNCGLFSEPNLEGLTCPPSLLDAWIVAARQYRNAGLATSLQSAPQLKRLRKVFQAMKYRIGFALDSSMETSFGAREEFRISWELFTAVNPSTSQPHGSHRPFWMLPTARVNEFIRWEFNRWLSAIEFVRSRGSRRDTYWEDHQRNMIMVTILLRSLKASVNCHHVAKRSQMFKGTYKNRQGKPLRGLDFQSSMHQTGLAWLPPDLFDWSNFHLRDDLVESTTFTFNGLKGVFRNWKDVDSVSREYCKARKLEQCLRTGEPSAHPDILDRMRKMVYRQFALQVIRQTCSSLVPESRLESEHQTAWEGYQGLSFDIIHTLAGEPPCLSYAREGSHQLGRTYHDRVQGLFDWDDGIPRTLWGHCYYRQLTRRFHASIGTHLGPADAENWKASLGRHALPHFWIIPHYNKHSLFTKLPKGPGQPNVIRPFISGLHQWRIWEDDMEPYREDRWLLGGDFHMSGFPASLLPENEAGTETENENENGIETGAGTENETEASAAEMSLQTFSIDFGCPVPFTKIPRTIEAGLEFTRRVYASGNPKILAHYETARDCLEQALGDPLCDLLLMIVLTFVSSTVTPTLPQHKTDFEPGPRRYRELLAVTLMTRMLWFLYPQWFPWESDDDMILSVPEMTKKMEKRGINNRILCKLGWVVRCATSRSRENPRNYELDLSSEEKLLELRAELLSQMNNPPAFIALVFDTQDDVWVERCLRIIRTHGT